MSLGESSGVSAAGLDHLVLSTRNVEARARASRVGEQLGRIIAALKPQVAALDWYEGNDNERIASTDEIKLEEHFGGWLDLVFQVGADAKDKSPEWFNDIIYADLVINKYARPFDSMRLEERNPVEDTIITFTPLQEPNIPDDLPFPLYETTGEGGWQLEAHEIDIAIGVLSVIASDLEAQTKAAGTA